MNRPTLKASLDGREVRIEWGPFSLSVEEARQMARELLNVSGEAESLPDFHQAHVDLLASCALCRHEVGGQTDRLVWEDQA